MWQFASSRWTAHERCHGLKNASVYLCTTETSSTVVYMGVSWPPKKKKKMVLPFFSSLTNQIKPNWIRKQCRLYTCESHGCIRRRNSFYVNKWQLCGAEKQSKAITKHSDFTMFNFRAGQNMFTALYNFLLALTCMHWALLHNYSTVSEFFFNTFSSIWILARLYQQSKP